jgi:sporulation protein YlmC with PRC-barrel domain
MQLLASKLTDSNVFSVHAGHNIAKVKTWLVDQKDLKISLLVTENKRRQLMYLQTNDIRSVGIVNGPCVIVDDEDKLSEKDELLRHQQMIKSGKSLIGFKVRTSSGRAIGKVKDMALDQQDLYILKLHIRARMPQRILQSSLLVDRSDIVGIKKDVIIIKDGFVKSQSTVKKALPA